MTEAQQETDRIWICEQVTTYSQQFSYYRRYAQVLKQVLDQAMRHVAPLAIVQARPKAIPSFAEKVWRKRFKYRNPLHRMTDLCGARVITQTQTDVNAVCEFVKAHFSIDWENSLDVSQRLKPTEFGYRSVHYIVQFKPGVFPSKDVNVVIPQPLFPKKSRPMKAEIQVRTVLEHAWAGFSHDKAYKGAFAIPDKWERQLAGLAAMLEEVDESFSRIQRGLQTYAANYGAYMSEDEMRGDKEMWKGVLACDPTNAEVAYRIGKLAMTLGDWEGALEVFSRYAAAEYQPILRDLGVTMCKVHRDAPQSPRYQEGQRYLEAASAPPYQDVDALASLAGTWKAIDEDKARELYRRAFEMNPSDPYAVSNYLVYEIVYRHDASLVALMEPIVARALQRCREQADVGMNLPWAFYNMGIFHLLLGRPYQSLAAYAKAIQLSTNDWMIETSLRLLDKLEAMSNELVGYEWARQLLQLGRVLKFPTPELESRVRELASKGYEPPQGPVVIVTGGCDVSVEDQMQNYREFLLQGFQDFRGTVICGGTTSGISGLVGEAQALYPQTVRTIGYIPRLVPAGITIDERYKELRRTEGHDFSPLEALRYWIDLTAAGIQPAQVKLLGIDGGNISAVEYRVALAFGAHLAVVAGSGRAATDLMADGDWATSRSLTRLPADKMAVRAFVGTGAPKLEPDVRATLARAIHAAYRETQAISQRAGDPALGEWDALPPDLKESNSQQADHIGEKLRAIRCTMRKVEGREPVLVTFSDRQVEAMAEMEHGRWVVERLQEGWTFGEKRNVVEKTHPSLVPWSQLPDTEKEKNRETVRRIPDFLAKVGLEVSATT
jgi:ppGpp synthetase/RelA/SpoT-type nucleotidyltranferase